MAESAQDELAWDYTADECSPLLRRAVSPHSRRKQACTLTHNQAQYLLHSLTEATQILHSELRQRSPEDGRTTETATGTTQGTTDTFSAVFLFYHRYVGYLPAVIITLQIVMVLIETVIDTSSGIHQDALHKPFTSAVFVSLSVVFLLLFYVHLMKRVFDRSASFSAILLSFAATSILFANIYAVFFRFNDIGWVFPFKISSSEPFVLTFLRMAHVSISVFTFSQGVSGMQVVTWYPLTVLSIQMLLAYGHLVIIIKTVMTSLLPSASYSIPSRPVEYLLSQRDPDTESLSFGTHLAPLLNSHPIPVIHPERAGVHSHEDGLLLSNSI